jgi:thiol-disulfide isomerase/thioredoxin
MRYLTVGALALGLATTAFAQSPAPARKVYDESADARAEIARAITEAQHDHKRILLVFGGNWCGDCLALDARFHESPSESIIKASFLVIHVDIGHADKNLDLASKYGIPLNKGVPAVAVLESDGKLLYSQKNGEFEPARRMEPGVFVEFLNHWKPAGL